MQELYIDGGVAVATHCLVEAEVGGLVADVNLGQTGLELRRDIGAVGGLGQGGQGHAGGHEEVFQLHGEYGVDSKDLSLLVNGVESGC